RQRGVGLSFEIDGAAEWLADLFAAAGLDEKPATGHDWEYDLGVAAVAPTIPDGFIVESLGGEPTADYPGIAECVKAAFGASHDVEAALISLQSNPMFRPELSVVARSPEGRIAAYCRGTVDPVNGICSIDPVCCHPDFQRLGLSKAIVRTCFLAQRDLGGRFSYIGSAPEPAPGTFLYRSLGPSRVTVNSSWTMTASGDSA
ncbi:MAG: GNAT family N-acetyltransferase, partial [bacterium]|nr:GNAT family N-acetyltransferase [bacterium]